MKDFLQGDSKESRRSFLGKSIAAAGGASGMGGIVSADEKVEEPKAERLVRELIGSLSEEQQDKEQDHEYLRTTNPTEHMLAFPPG